MKRFQLRYWDVDAQMFDETRRAAYRSGGGAVVWTMPYSRRSGARRHGKRHDDLLERFDGCGGDGRHEVLVAERVLAALGVPWSPSRRERAEGNDSPRDHPLGNGSALKPVPHAKEYEFTTGAPITEQEALDQVTALGLQGLAFDDVHEEDETLRVRSRVSAPQ